MKYIMIDIESDGPIPHDYSMICFGAVVVEKGLNRTFLGHLKPISENYIPEALAVSGYTREETLSFPESLETMKKFEEWLRSLNSDRLMFIADNNGFDWQFINWYFHHFLKHNPFGFSSTNLGSLYKGIVNDMSKSFKYLRKTRHTHNPVDDAMGNAEALLEIRNRFGLRINI